jgi:hypothetical protein
MFRAFFLAVLTVLALGAAPASAQPRRSPDVQPLDRVLPQVRSRYPGNFYDADGPFLDESGNPHYRLKWMTPEGRVMWLDTDARTGRVLGVEHGGRRGGERYNAPPRDAPPPPDFEGRGRYDNGDRGDNPYRGRERWQHAPDGGDRGWGGRGNWNGGGRGNWNGGGHGNWSGGDHGGHGGGHHGHGH